MTLKFSRFNPEMLRCRRPSRTQIKTQIMTLTEDLDSYFLNILTFFGGLMSSPAPSNISKVGIMEVGGTYDTTEAYHRLGLLTLHK